MFKKICFSPTENDIKTHDVKKVSANPEITERFNKLARNLKSIAPKSDDFLYFSIIFLKAAESALLDDNGKIKKVGKEDAWGFFDENWKWHGNVKPHRNNNKDIFPESQLKIAAPLWVGKPLCRDHESSSVDGIRGIILDTYYDEKFKQVVGLCALDKVNYADLARKVETGLVRYGSMGTAVETSICTECGNKATTQDEYCEHIISRAAHGEINVGLKPIEYSLVVQPAEPGAILLKCIASLNEYRQEFINYGVKNVPEMLGALSEKQAQHLDGIMKMACGEGGCSISDRKRIVTSFLNNNGLIKSSGADSEKAETARNLAGAIKEYSEHIDGDLPPEIVNLLRDSIVDTNVAPEGPSFTSSEISERGRNPGDTRPFYADSTTIDLGGVVDSGDNPDFSNNEDLLNFNPSGEAAVAVTASGHKTADKDALLKESVENIDDLTISSILEDIMNESRLKKRAELRRRIAYMQGGSEGREPNTFKSEDFNRDQDKHMHQTGNMGGADGMVPGDKETKEKMSRAELEERRLKRMAYMQGGSEGREPAYKGDAPFGHNQDKHMHQTGNMGGTDGMAPGDKEVKEKMSRASAYSGPSLRTRFLVKTNSDGTVNRGRSTFQVFAGDKRVISATASEIFGPELNDNWDWLRSREYGKEVCKQIRASGLQTVSTLLKSAQAAPELPELPELPAAGGDEGAPMPPVDAGGMEEEPMMPELDDDAGEEEAEAADPAVEIDNRLADMEGLINEVRDLVDELQDQRMADVDVNVFTGKGKEGEEEIVDAGMTALSSAVLTNLKESFAKLDNSADELSMVAETFENINKLSAGQASEFKKLASDAVKDADRITGEARAVVKLAGAMKNHMMAEDAASYAEDGDDAMDHHDHADKADDHAKHVEDAAEDELSALMSSAMDLRRSRREAILKQANDRVLSQRAAARAALLKNAEDHSEKAEDDGEDHAMADDQTAEDALDNLMTEASSNNPVKQALAEKVAEKKANEAREAYRVKLRRAYDVGMDMQRKGLLPTTKVALDNQVDEIMQFDDRAFESFKRSIANTKPVRSVKIASDLGGVNIGVEEEAQVSASERMTANALSSLWD